MKIKKPTENGGRWVVQVYQEQHVSRKDFETASAASEWAAKFACEVNIKAGSDFHDLRVSDIFDRYAREESPRKANRRKEVTMFRYFKTKLDEETGEKKYPIVDVFLKDLTRFDFVKFRDRRQNDVAAGTFRQDWSLFHRAIKMALNEWGWIHRDPMVGIRIPANPRLRRRRISQEEIDRITDAILSHPTRLPERGSHIRALLIFQLALETALRKTEILSLKREEVFLEQGYLKVSGLERGARKSYAAVRDVPLTSRAREILQTAIDWNWHPVFVFGDIRGNFEDVFHSAVKRSGIKNLHFHDTRHEAISRLARFFRSLDLATIVGHRDVQELMTYYQPTITDLVEILHESEHNGFKETRN